MKILPRAEIETPEQAETHVPNTHNRRFPIKVMFMGVASRPYLEHDFVGKIYMKRVADEVNASRNLYNQYISDFYEINADLKKGAWVDNFKPFSEHQDLMVLDTQQVICSTYGLEEDMELVFSYKNCSVTGNTFKWI